MVTDKTDEPKKIERSTALLLCALLSASASDKPRITNAGVDISTNYRSPVDIVHAGNSVMAYEGVQARAGWNLPWPHAIVSSR